MTNNRANFYQLKHKNSILYCVMLLCKRKIKVNLNYDKYMISLFLNGL